MPDKQNSHPPAGSTPDRPQSTAGHTIAMEMEAFLEDLEGRIQKDRERLFTRITAWANLLDAAGWSVALKLDDDENPWLGEQAKRWWAENGDGTGIDSMSWDWLRLNLPKELIMICDQRVLVWGRLAEKDSGTPSQDLNGDLTKSLTRREKEVMDWVSCGKTNPEIAIILGCSVRTIEKHVENIFRKTGVTSRNELILHSSTHQPDS